MQGEAEAAGAHEVSREGCKQERRTNLRVSREQALQAKSAQRGGSGTGEGGEEPR